MKIEYIVYSILTNKMRTDNITWEEYFMLSARLAAERSKDPCTQVGAVIVNDRNRIIGSGYNGFCNGIPDYPHRWGKNQYDNQSLFDMEQNKHTYVCHAEMNAIMNCSITPQGCTMYVTLHPCNECAKLIIQSGIKKVVHADYPKEFKKIATSAHILKSTGVVVESYSRRDYGKSITLTI